MSSPSDSPPVKSIYSYLQGWGLSSMAPLGLASLITAVHGRPFQAIPMLAITPMLLLSSYLNVGGYKADSAGLSAAWSGIYLLLSARRGLFPRGPAPGRPRFSAKNGVRLTAMSLAGVNTVAGSLVYATTDREAEKRDREEKDRWGIEAAKKGA